MAASSRIRPTRLRPLLGALLRPVVVLPVVVVTVVVLAGAACSAGPRPAATTSLRAPAVAAAHRPGQPPGYLAPGYLAPGYLALGDSIAFGYQPPEVRPAPDYHDPADFTGYPEDLARALGLTVVNAACPGETSGSMINTRAPSNGCERNAAGGGGYRPALPLHVSYPGSQLEFAVGYLQQHPDTRLVTIGIGGNDLFRCQEVTGHCRGTVLSQTLAATTANLDLILAALRGQAGYQGSLVVVEYYAVNYRDQLFVHQIEALNAALAGPAARYGATLADTFSAFRAASAGAGDDTCTAGLTFKLPGGCDLHPTARGQQLLATVIERAIAPVAAG
ncbi:MAG: SGNH/GDSL hydrolase family protein [Streptosporangiaceae bacterium]